MSTDTEENRRLIGGDIERRVASSRYAPLAGDHLLAPLRDPSTRSDFESHIGRPGLHVEIGFARAHHICALAAQLPEAPVLGFELKRSWCSGAAKRAKRLGLSNLKVVEGDARPYLEGLFQPESVAAFHALFPDPWWKRKHHKRRLFEPHLIERLHGLLKPGGYLVAKTDVPAYADLIASEMESHGGWRLVGLSNEDPVLAALPRSHREKKCRELGIPIFAYRYEKETLP